MVKSFPMNCRKQYLKVELVWSKGRRMILSPVAWILFPMANNHFQSFVRFLFLPPTPQCQMVLFKVCSSTCVGFLCYNMQHQWQEDCYTGGVIQSIVDTCRLQTSVMCYTQRLVMEILMQTISNNFLEKEKGCTYYIRFEIIKNIYICQPCEFVSNANGLISYNCKVVSDWL